jgi:hypothetical protein
MLSNEEFSRRKNRNLCLRCGYAGHKTYNCTRDAITDLKKEQQVHAINTNKNNSDNELISEYNHKEQVQKENLNTNNNCLNLLQTNKDVEDLLITTESTNKNLKDPRMYTGAIIDIKKEKKVHNCLIDHGSTITVFKSPFKEKNSIIVPAYSASGHAISNRKRLSENRPVKTKWGNKNLKVYYTQSLPHKGILGIDWCKTNNINIDLSGKGDITQSTPKDDKTITINKKQSTENDDIFKEIPELQTFFTFTNSLPSRKHYYFGIDLNLTLN